MYLFDVARRASFQHVQIRFSWQHVHLQQFGFVLQCSARPIRIHKSRATKKSDHRRGIVSQAGRPHGAETERGIAACICSATTEISETVEQFASNQAQISDEKYLRLHSDRDQTVLCHVWHPRTNSSQTRASFVLGSAHLALEQSATIWIGEPVDWGAEHTEHDREQNVERIETRSGFACQDETVAQTLHAKEARSDQSEKIGIPVYQREEEEQEIDCFLECLISCFFVASQAMI